MDISALLQQIFDFILQLLDAVFAFAGNGGGTDDNGGDDNSGQDS